jgi:hypothetical protein
MELTNIAADVPLDEKLLAQLRMVICELLADINEIADRFEKLPPIDQSVTLSETPISLKRAHRYGLLFLGNPIDLLIDMCGIGKVCVPMRIGWNDVSCLPEGTTIALASDSSLRAVYRCIDTLE